jgi:mono/diheme cytochrome c family protein
MNERQMRRKTRCALIILMFLNVTTPPVFAAGNAANGLKLARHWCASCHIVDPKDTGNDAAPPFRALAHRRDKNWIKVWLSAPHPPMTGIDLSRAQIDDITAYLESLPSN